MRFESQRVKKILTRPALIGQVSHTKSVNFMRHMILRTTEIWPKPATLLLQAAFLIGAAILVRADDELSLNIVPAPVNVKTISGTFTLSERTRIVAADAESRRIADLFNDFLLNNQGFHLKIVTSIPTNATYVLFTETGGQKLPAEGYELAVKPAGIRVVGRGAGLFYGMQTLLQMLPLDLNPSVPLPAVEIKDYPRFHYRGVLLDVGRHFFSVTEIKKILDLMAQYKLNRFHWHLTDDQGWRLEIKKYPRLTEIGFQGPIPGEQNSDPYVRGYYSQAQIKEVVDYARARFITIVPEIEMPGHSGAA